MPIENHVDCPALQDRGAGSAPNTRNPLPQFKVSRYSGKGIAMPEESSACAVAADRLLLYLAAKAGRIEIELCTCSDPKWPYRLAGKSGVRAHWNPLIDDGDALRLAVVMGRMDRLGLAIHIVEPLDGDTGAYTWIDAERFGEFNHYHGDDPFAATRRAIVEAAAEIGRRS